VWQKAFEKYQSEGFTVVGIALDAEGIPPAKRYYDKYGVTFPALVDPNYATRLTTVPHTYLVDEHGVVRKVLRGPDGLDKLIKPVKELRPVTDKVRAQWSEPARRLDKEAIRALMKKHKEDAKDLQTAVQLASRLLDRERTGEARKVLEAAVESYDARKVARGKDEEKTRLLGQAYFQLSRACIGDREAQVKHATLSFYLAPSVGYGKQIARIIAPEKFDGRPGGDFDNRFREATLRRLRKEREQWLRGK
jgi:hypothetical protein